MLLAIYLLQKIDFSSWIGDFSPNMKFVLNRTFRFMVNDISCLLLIAAMFNKSGYLRLATWIFLIEFIILLPVYFVIKISLEGPTEISSPLLSQWHRMIVNPLLMIVLILGFLYQDYIHKNNYPQ